jgi:hypothetical protein
LKNCIAENKFSAEKEAKGCELLSEHFHSGRHQLCTAAHSTFAHLGEHKALGEF